MSVEYRPEIDGLRALAVVSVVLFHAKVPGFSGGFVGVDIFFVISGFLITSIIHDQHINRRYSYADFLERRIRRILPALAVVMLVSIPFAHALMLPDPLENFGQSIVATALSANNILLWLTSGYWDLASEFKPFLHTWSLGVEEQFYLIYPFALIAALRLPPRPRLAVFAIVALLSYVAMLRRAPADPSGAFYLLPFRAWQLLIGGMAALAVRDFATPRQPLLAALGVALMLATILGSSLTETYLAYSLPIASLGAVLFLSFAEAGTWPSWPFTRRGVVFVGLVSYSFYLWHQPVFAFTRIAMFEEPNGVHYASAIGLAFGLSILTQRYVELPFRMRAKTNRRFVYMSMAATMGLLVAVGLAMHVSKGLPSRMQSTEGVAANAGASIAYNERIRSRLPSDFETAPAGVPRVLIAGNSFARDFANVLLEANVGQSASLVYRDDIRPCPLEWDTDDRHLIETADVVVFASGTYEISCIDELDRIRAQQAGYPDFWFVGPKHFGSNLNPLVRMSPRERSETRLEVPSGTLRLNAKQAERLGAHYVDLLAVLSEDGAHIRVADLDGKLLTTDRIHLSKAGAVWLAGHLSDIAPGLHALAVAQPGVAD